MKSSELRNLIREEVRKALTEAKAPSFKAKHKNNNLVAAIYFSWNKALNNDQSLWDKVIQILDQEDCRLINYVVTDSVCEFEFAPRGVMTAELTSQDELEETKNNVEDALKPLAAKYATGYDVYIVGN